MRNIVACKLERGFSTDTRLGIFGERGKTVEFFEDSQVSLSRFNGVEAAEILVMVIKAEDNQLGDIVGSGDGFTTDGIHQFRPMFFDEIEDGNGSRGSLHVVISELDDLLVTRKGYFRGDYIEDGIDLLFKQLGFRVLLGIPWAIDIFDVFLDILQGMKYALMVFRVGKYLGNARAIILA